jgi:hypothetical protein
VAFSTFIQLLVRQFDISPTFRLAIKFFLGKWELELEIVYGLHIPAREDIMGTADQKNGNAYQ